MSSLNQVQIIGNLGKDPEMRSMPSGDQIANFSVACSDRWKDKASGEQKERTEWINFAMFGPLAGIAGNYLKKGSKVFLQGALRTRKWTDKEGIDRYSTEVVVDSFNGKMVMLSGKENENSSRQKTERTSAVTTSQLDDFDDSEIPF